MLHRTWTLQGKGGFFQWHSTGLPHLQQGWSIAVVSKSWIAASWKSHPCAVLIILCCSILPCQPTYPETRAGQPLLSIIPAGYMSRFLGRSGCLMQVSRQSKWQVKVQQFRTVRDSLHGYGFFRMLDLAQGPEFGTCRSVAVLGLLM